MRRRASLLASLLARGNCLRQMSNYFIWLCGVFNSAPGAPLELPRNACGSVSIGHSRSPSSLAALPPRMAAFCFDDSPRMRLTKPSGSQSASQTG